MAAALWALLPLLAAIAPRPAGSAQAPLLVWSTERSLWPPLTVPGGRVLSEPELQQLLEPGLQRGPRTVLLFLQDQLSLEDFAAFGGAFEPGTGSGAGTGNGAGTGTAFARLQDALASAGSALTLPSVAGGAVAALPRTLQRLLGAPSALPLPGGALGGLRLNRSEAESRGEPALLLVGLPHSRGSGLMGPKEALTSNDAVLGAVLRALQDERIPYTALLTARRAGDPPLPGGLPVDLGVPRRSLLAAPEATPPPLRWPPLGDPKSSSGPGTSRWLWGGGART